jgi:hypothetical protein
MDKRRPAVRIGCRKGKGQPSLTCLTATPIFCVSLSTSPRPLPPSFLTPNLTLIFPIAYGSPILVFCLRTQGLDVWRARELSVVPSSHVQLSLTTNDTSTRRKGIKRLENTTYKEYNEDIWQTKAEPWKTGRLPQTTASLGSRIGVDARPGMRQIN